MKCLHAALMASGMVLASTGAPPVGVPVNAVSVPIDKVTVPLSRVTVDERSVTYTPTPRPTEAELAVRARDVARPVADRLAALDALRDQDEIFGLVFRPGADTNETIRIRAVARLAEVEIPRTLTRRSEALLPTVRAAALARVGRAYADDRAVGRNVSSAVVRDYARRLRARLAEQ